MKAGDRASEAEARRRAREADKQDRDDVRTLMSTVEGRRLVWRFLTHCGVFNSAFNTNAMSQSHAIGWQDAGRWWLAEIDRACPELYPVMANEARKRAKLAEDNDETEEHDDD